MPSSCASALLSRHGKAAGGAAPAERGGSVVAGAVGGGAAALPLPAPLRAGGGLDPGGLTGFALSACGVIGVEAPACAASAMRRARQVSKSSTAPFVGGGVERTGDVMGPAVLSSATGAGGGAAGLITTGAERASVDVE